MSIRTDLINAKVNGDLNKVASEKLGKLITNFQDFSMFVDILEEKQAASKFSPFPISPRVLKGILLAGVVGSAGIGALGHLKTKKTHRSVLEQLKKDPRFTDKPKVENIYNMISQFAPNVSTNYTFSKSVMDQLYEAPIITATMVKEIVDVEKGIAGKKSFGIPDIIKATESAKSLMA